MTRRTNRAPRKTAASAPRATATMVSIPGEPVVGVALLTDTGEFIFRTKIDLNWPTRSKENRENYFEKVRLSFFLASACNSAENALKTRLKYCFRTCHNSHIHSGRRRLLRIVPIMIYWIMVPIVPKYYAVTRVTSRDWSQTLFLSPSLSQDLTLKLCG